MDIEEIIGMKVMKEVGVGLEKGPTQVTSEGMTGVVVIAGQDQDQEQVLIETELGVTSVESMIILQRLSHNKRRKRDRSNKQMFNLDEEETYLNTLATDTYDSLNHVNSLE